MSFIACPPKWDDISVCGNGSWLGLKVYGLQESRRSIYRQTPQTTLAVLLYTVGCLQRQAARPPLALLVSLWEAESALITSVL
jgi:hypothetical protein